MMQVLGLLGGTVGTVLTGDPAMMMVGSQLGNLGGSLFGGGPAAGATPAAAAPAMSGAGMGGSGAGTGGSVVPVSTGAPPSATPSMTSMAGPSGAAANPALSTDPLLGPMAMGDVGGAFMNYYTMTQMQKLRNMTAYAPVSGSATGAMPNFNLKSQLPFTQPQF
jgi:hypothetical protein